MICRMRSLAVRSMELDEMPHQIKTDAIGFHLTDLPQNGGNKFCRVVFP
jgi:hypothetical protein